MMSLRLCGDAANINYVRKISGNFLRKIRVRLMMLEGSTSTSILNVLPSLNLVHFVVYTNQPAVTGCLVEQSELV